MVELPGTAPGSTNAYSVNTFSVIAGTSPAVPLYRLVGVDFKGNLFFGLV